MSHFTLGNLNPPVKPPAKPPVKRTVWFFRLHSFSHLVPCVSIAADFLTSGVFPCTEPSHILIYRLGKSFGVGREPEWRRTQRIHGGSASHATDVMISRSDVFASALQRLASDASGCACTAQLTGQCAHLAVDRNTVSGRFHRGARRYSTNRNQRQLM